MQFFRIADKGAIPPFRRTVKVSHGGLSGHKSKMKFFSDYYHCQAEWHAEGVLTMNIPAQEPKLSVVALLKPNKSRERRRELLRAHAPGDHWREALCCDEDGYEVRVYTKNGM